MEEERLSAATHPVGKYRELNGLLGGWQILTVVTGFLNKASLRMKARWLKRNVSLGIPGLIKVVSIIHDRNSFALVSCVPAAFAF